MQKVLTAIVIFCVLVFGFLFLMAEVPKIFENFEVKNNFSKTQNEPKPERLKKSPKKHYSPRKNDYNKDDFSVTKNFSI